MSKRKKEERGKKQKKKGKEQVGRLRTAIESLLSESAGRGLSMKQIIKKIGL